MKEIKRCAHCEKVLIDRRDNVKFCNHNCRSYYYKKESREKNKLIKKSKIYKELLTQNVDKNLIDLFNLIYKK